MPPIQNAVSAPAATTNTRYALGVALASFATLLLELALTRLFSVVLFYHFAFLAISIALLGLGAGGVFAFTRKAQLARWETMQLAQRLCLGSALATLIALEVVLHVPVALNLTGGNFLRLTAIYLAAAVPFFFTGLMFSTIFARAPERISHLYGADLMGGAAACLAVVPLLNLIGGPNAIVFAALAMAGAGESGAAWPAYRYSLCKGHAPRSALGGVLALERHLAGRGRPDGHVEVHRDRCRRLNRHHERGSAQVAGHGVAARSDGCGPGSGERAAAAGRLRHHRAARRG
jgi:hypothetical protein